MSNLPEGFTDSDFEIISRKVEIYKYQQLIGQTNNTLYQRTYKGNAWTEWIRVDNYGTSSLSELASALGGQLGVKNISLGGSVGTVIESGIGINRGNGGCTAMVVFSTNTGNGTSTISIVGQLQFYYDGNNLPTFTKISGNGELESYIQIGKNANNQLIFTKVVGHQMYMSLLLSR